MSTYPIASRLNPLLPINIWRSICGQPQSHVSVGEDETTFGNFLDLMYFSYRPADEHEGFLLGEISRLTWLTRRNEMLQTKLYDEEFSKSEPSMKAFIKPLQVLLKQYALFIAQMRRYKLEFDKLQKQRMTQPSAPADVQSTVKDLEEMQKLRKEITEALKVDAAIAPQPANELLEKGDFKKLLRHPENPKLRNRKGAQFIDRILAAK